MNTQHKSIKLKAVVSCLLILLLLLVSITGAMLYFGKTGLILGFSRAFLLNFHARCAILFLALAICHLMLNFKLLTSGLKSWFKR